MPNMRMEAEERLKHVREYAGRCIKEEAQAVLDLLPQLDENFDKAVGLMYKCRGKVIVTGVGKSGHIGAKIAATLSSTGTPSLFINPLDVFHGDLGVMTKDDVVLAISYSGHRSYKCTGGKGGMSAEPCPDEQYNGGSCYG